MQYPPQQPPNQHTQYQPAPPPWPLQQDWQQPQYYQPPWQQPIPQPLPPPFWQQSQRPVRTGVKTAAILCYIAGVVVSTFGGPSYLLITVLFSLSCFVLIFFI